MNQNDSILERIIDTLEGVLESSAGREAIIDTMKLIPDGGDFDLEREALHQAMHFWIDSDLRKKDKEYDEYMRAELLSYKFQMIKKASA